MTLPPQSKEAAKAVSKKKLGAATAPPLPITAVLSEKCRTLLEERRTMWVEALPHAPESIRDLAQEVLFVRSTHLN